MLKLYGFSKVNAAARGHTRDPRVLWALQEMQLPFELVGMDHPAHDLNTEAYRRLSPFEQIPSIDDDGLVLSESAAIVVELAPEVLDDFDRFLDHLVRFEVADAAEREQFVLLARVLGAGQKARRRMFGSTCMSNSMRLGIRSNASRDMPVALTNERSIRRPGHRRHGAWQACARGTPGELTHASARGDGRRVALGEAARSWLIPGSWHGRDAADGFRQNLPRCRRLRR